MKYRKLVCSLIILLGVSILTGNQLRKFIQYNTAIKLLDNGSYDEAITSFRNLGKYKNSTDMVTESRYQRAVSLYENKNYREAYDAFTVLSNYNYKDSVEYLEKFEMKQIGDIITFGNYEWYIISTSSDGYTLLCKDIIYLYKGLYCYMPYHNKNTAITWEDCSIRSWLNDSFYNEFNDEEKERITKTICENSNNNIYNTSGGNDTEDYIFLLSIDETKNIDKKMLASVGKWWLRSPGYEQYYAAEVFVDGMIDTRGYVVDSESGIRPALNLKF